MATQAAKAAVATAVETVAAPVTAAAVRVPQANFVRGHKQVFLPWARVTMIRPHPGTSPYWATFVVPLNFNKLDLRDYLWHVYKVPVLKVRSFVNARPLESLGQYAAAGTFRPRSQKMMMVELESPFVWPERRKGEDLPSDYDWERSKRLQDADEAQADERIIRQRGEIPMLTQRPLDKPLRGRPALAEEARALLEGKKVWDNELRLDERWSELNRGEKKRK